MFHVFPFVLFQPPTGNELEKDVGDSPLAPTTDQKAWCMMVAGVLRPMEAALLEQLEEYMVYMGELGFSGLAVEHNPFQRPVVAPIRVPNVQPRVPEPQTRRAAPPPRPVRPTVAAAPPAKAKVQMPNLLSIMDMVGEVAPLEDTRAKVAAIRGTSKVDTLRQLYNAFNQCQACALSTTRKCFVFGEGPPESRLMIVGGAPGQEDDRTGRPFMGEAGQLLDRIIEAMGFKREQVFISNVVKCRPPHRSPLHDEVASCTPILAKQIETVAPKVILSLGPGPLRYFKGQDVSLQRYRGQIFSWRNIQIMPTYHPTYILRNPQSKREVWADIKKVMAILSGHS